jgi:hypothetical protein
VSDTFDINDRSTWAWMNGFEVRCQPGDGYLIDPLSPKHFYQCSDGVALRMPCPPDHVFNPRVTPGPVCDHPSNVSEADIYDWAVSTGLVDDQR